MSSWPTVIRHGVAIAAALVLLPLGARPLDAQYFTPLASYTFSGCFENAGCHTAYVLVGDADPTLNFRHVDPSLKAMMFGLTHQLPAGTALAGMPPHPFAYGIVSPTGQRFVWDDDDIYRGGACPSVGYATSPTTCTGGFGPIDFELGTPRLVSGLAGWVTPDWSPTAFTVGVRLGTPGGLVLPGDEYRSLSLPLVSVTSVVPEPSTVALVGGGLALLAGGAWRRRRG